MSNFVLGSTRTFLAITILGGSTSGWAAEKNQADDNEPLSFKLTPSFYRQSDSNNAIDINLRASRGPHTEWIGFYRDHADFQQVRFGYEFTQDTGPLHIIWSAQAASRGFLGGSINAQLGQNIYPILGFGRTNLRPYNNINFDPNDMMTVGLGSKLIPGTEFSVYHIWDNRLGTKQHVTHVYLHRDLPEQRRFSIDVSYKRGLNSENNFVSGYAVTLTYAWSKYFIRIARDQYVNFGTATQSRLSIGIEF